MKLPSRSIVQRLGWATTAHGATQGLRFLTNLVLTRLLTPEIFGIMLIVNTLRTGAEILSDIGIGQNVVSSVNSEKKDFLETAFTLQVFRGLLLGALIACFALPLSAIYKNELLAQLLPLAGIITATLGLESINRFLAQRNQKFARLTAMEITIGIISSLANIGFAWFIPSAWGLIYANITSAILTVVCTYVFFGTSIPRISINRQYAIEIFHYGKWIFLSSIVYFISMNFDRLYLGAAVSLSLLGVFGVARSLTEVIATLVIRVGNYIVFPAVATSRDDRTELRRKLSHSRTLLMLLAATGISIFASLSDTLIEILYDDRYRMAGFMLPILASGIWFTVITTTGEAVLLGLGRPIFGAAGNFAKLIWLVIGLPIAVSTHGIFGAVVVIALADGVRYLPIWFALRKEQLSFGRQDLGVTLLLFGMIGLWREVFGLLGLTSGWSGWWTMAQGLMK